MLTAQRALVFLTLGIWVYLNWARGLFWALRERLTPDSAPARVIAVIPARNEEQTIAAAAASLAGQVEAILVVDDSSTDGTRGEAEKIAGVEVVTAPPLPPGWTGKMWAVSSGVEAALARDPEFLLLTDADIVHAPGSIGHLAAQAAGFDLVSVMVRLRCESLPERALIPAFVYFFFQLYPPRWIASPRRRIAGAAGGCILIRPAALALAGGIEGIRNELIDDCALARRVKGSGGRVWLGLGPENTRSIRVYGAWGEIAHMIARTAFTQLGYSTPLLVGTIGSLLLTYVAPFALLFTGDRFTTERAVLAVLLMLRTYLPILRLYRRSPVWLVALPLIATFYLGATVQSAVRYWSGRGGQWKGRVQAV